MDPTLTIFFDLDGTLYSYRDGHSKGLQGAYKYWKEVTNESFEQFMSKYHKARKNVKRFLRGTVASHSRALYFQDMVDFHFEKSMPYHIAELSERYWNAFIDSIEPFDGVEQTLMTLQEKGYQLAIITNMSAQLQMRKLHKLQLDNYFDAVITSEEAGQEKPHPHIYLHAVNRLTIKPSHAIMIGDNYEHDVESAEFVGLQGILIAIEEEYPGINSRKVYIFSELVDIIDDIAAEPLEGVIKYKLNHRNATMGIDPARLDDLVELRDELYQLNLIGVYPNDHYLTPSVGFGNASQRYTSNGQFVISGSQTGDLEQTEISDYALVLDYDIDNNQLVSKGMTRPSSESLTHAAIYAIAPDVNYVIHVHHRDMWERYEELDMLTTPEDVPYGTPEMARAIQGAYHENPILARPVCMLGHTEGLLTWGKTRDEALELYKEALNSLTQLD